VCVGKKGRDFFRKQPVETLASHIDLQGAVNAPLMAEITDTLVNRFVARDTDRVVIIYNSFVNMMKYVPTIVDLLPLQPDDLLGEDAEAGATGGAEMIFEPNAEQVFGVVLERYLRVRAVTCQADALTAEHSARMISMSNATENCKELKQSLTLEMNKARQAAITKELLEIVSGAEALKG